MTVLKTETETAVFSHNTDRNRPSSDDPQPLQHYLKGEYVQSDAFYRHKLLYRTLIGSHRHAIDKQASYTAYNPTALT